MGYPQGLHDLTYYLYTRIALYFVEMIANFFYGF
jgi:hypothetical protein